MGESNSVTHSDLLNADIDFVRKAIRRNAYSGHTAGLCAGKLQCNLVILPNRYASEFKTYCANNPIACPLLGQSIPGAVHFEEFGAGIDLRTDLPRYRIYKNGLLTEECSDIEVFWRADLVAFAIGCSFTFEKALASAGIAMRHIEENSTVPMFKTNISTHAVGPFSGPTVVSMRPIKRTDLERVREICSSYPHAHGVPIHVGDPSIIGIEDAFDPDWGNAVSFRDDEVPVFWGCGVTSQLAISHALLDLCITHAPGAMLITNIDELANSDWRAAGPPDEIDY